MENRSRKHEGRYNAFTYKLNTHKPMHHKPLNNSIAPKIEHFRKPQRDSSHRRNGGSYRQHRYEDTSNIFRPRHNNGPHHEQRNRSGNDQDNSHNHRDNSHNDHRDNSHNDHRDNSHNDHRDNSHNDHRDNSHNDHRDNSHNDHRDNSHNNHRDNSRNDQRNTSYNHQGSGPYNGRRNGYYNGYRNRPPAWYRNERRSGSFNGVRNRAANKYYNTHHPSHNFSKQDEQQCSRMDQPQYVQSRQKNWSIQQQNLPINQYPESYNGSANEPSNRHLNVSVPFVDEPPNVTGEYIQCPTNTSQHLPKNGKWEDNVSNIRECNSRSIHQTSNGIHLIKDISNCLLVNETSNMLLTMAANIESASQPESNYNSEKKHPNYKNLSSSRALNNFKKLLMLETLCAEVKMARRHNWKTKSSDASSLCENLEAEKRYCSYLDSSKIDLSVESMSSHYTFLNEADFPTAISPECLSNNSGSRKHKTLQANIENSVADTVLHTSELSTTTGSCVSSLSGSDVCMHKTLGNHFPNTVTFNEVVDRCSEMDSKDVIKNENTRQKIIGILESADTYESMVENLYTNGLQKMFVDSLSWRGRGSIIGSNAYESKKSSISRQTLTIPEYLQDTKSPSLETNLVHSNILPGEILVSNPNILHNITTDPVQCDDTHSSSDNIMDDSFADDPYASLQDPSIMSTPILA